MRNSVFILVYAITFLNASDTNECNTKSRPCPWDVECQITNGIYSCLYPRQNQDNTTFVYTFIETATSISSGYLVAFIPKLSSEYFLSFNFFPNNFDGRRSVICFSFDFEKCNSSVLSITVDPGGSLVFIKRHDNDFNEFKYPIALKMWSNIEITKTIIPQFESTFIIKINKKIVFSTTIRNDYERSNVNVYASDTLYKAQDSFIENFYFINGKIDFSESSPVVLPPKGMKFSNIWISHSTFLNHWRVSLFKKEFDENINNNQDSLGFWEVFNEKISVTINPFWTKLTNIILNFKISLLTYALQTSTLQVCFNPFRECDNISVKSSLIPIEKLLKFEQIKSVRVFDVSFVRFDYAQIYLFSVTASLEGIDWCNDTFLCPWKNSQCENTFGSYLCKCKNGWILGDDKSSCVDIDECKDNFPCNWNNSLCENTYGSYLCKCKNGWILGNDSSSCVELASPLEKSTIVISLPVSILVPLLIVIIIVVSVWIYRKKIKSQPILNTDISQSENYLDCKRQDSRKTADKWEIYPKTINIDKKIGEGAFGNVFIAKISSNIVAKTCYGRTVTGSVFLDIKDDFCINVAVKFLKDHANQLELNDFVEEINLMKGIGYHKNIVNMIGCSTLQKPLCLVVEFMENGDLLQFLKNSRAKLITSKVYKESSINFNSNYQNMPEKINSNSEVVSVDDNERVTPNDLINFAWQVASGMEYLSSIKLVHRDLAARNILVGADKIVKISDFGLTRKVNADLNYMGSNNRRLPIKWMSVEAIFDRTFTTYSDVWAYGIVLFEIVTLGGTPYPTISNRELLPLLKTGYRMERPDNCSQSMFDCMLKCWNEDPLQRPTFTKLCELFEELMSQSGNYFSLKIDEESTYYKVPSFHSNSNDFNDLV